MKEKFSLKDHLFNPKKVELLASEISSAWPQFPSEKFQSQTLKKFPELELKARITHIKIVLKECLPEDYPTALKIILNSLPKPCDPQKTDDDFGDFIYAPYSEFVATYGCAKRYLTTSLNALAEITQRFSAEYAIRPFINNFPKDTLEKLQEWLTHPHYHVRRLVSEGTRPKLPWAEGITLDPLTPLTLLDTLHSDPTRFVTRSVANHLNDISKKSPDQVLERLKTWKKTKKQSQKELDYITKHSLRTLIKKGHSNTLILLGYNPNAKINASLILNAPSVKIGEALNFTITLESSKKESILIDYIITYKTKSGKPSEKVYKLKTLTLETGTPQILRKTHPFKPNMSTRTLHPGEHFLTLQINGKKQTSIKFNLI